jgi:phosphoribosylformimino-5-aminoimidazole carboxamide ribotide isomerase
MRVIPVIDLMNGQVVRGVAGRRSEYRPIGSLIATDARPATVARAFVERFGFDVVYVADLDAIAGRGISLRALQEISNAGLRPWLDAGVGTTKACSTIRDLLRAESIEADIVIALESLHDDFRDEDWIYAFARAQAFAFSLDLKNGAPNHRVREWHGKSAIEIGRSARARGFSTIIVLDLADVGMGQGTHTLQLCKQLISELHPVRIIAGGGIRGIADLTALAEAGCFAALVASALHDGRLTAEEIRQFDNLPH